LPEVYIDMHIRVRLPKVPFALLVPSIVASTTLAVTLFGPLAATPAGAATAGPRSTHWSSCQSSAVSQAPRSFWRRIRSSTEHHSDIPGSFWTNRTYRDDIARIVCYESSFDYHAVNGGQYGWFQMNKPLIQSERVTFHQYWDGTHSDPPGWYEATAGERYIHSRYGNPAVAWQHENDYGWY
jgi:hypothetical protein